LRADLARAVPFQDGAPVVGTVLRLLTAPSWGGTFTAKTGEQVTVMVSDTYPEDPALAQRWADFLAGLVHGPELSTLTAFLAPADEVQTICGPEAIACYSPRDRTLVAPGEDPGADLSAEAVVTHEYGHHVAANRLNNPWLAVDYGTKRWATSANVCARTNVGELYPGAEDSPRYTLNPGEGFAEAYRVLNQRKAGVAESPWLAVSQELYPTDAQLALLEQDVVAPWAGSTTTRTRGSLARVRSRTSTVATPLDGTLRVGVRAAPRTRVALELLAGGRRVDRAVTIRGGARSLAAAICGQRSYRIRVTRVTGARTYTLSVTRP
jgi:hypothetical protein